MRKDCPPAQSKAHRHQREAYGHAMARGLDGLTAYKKSVAAFYEYVQQESIKPENK